MTMNLICARNSVNNTLIGNNFLFRIRMFLCADKQKVTRDVQFSEEPRQRETLFNVLTVDTLSFSPTVFF